MNERIQELASAADVWCDQNWFGHDLYNQRWEEKFAELIVRECIGLLGSESEYGRNHIKRHFGVEE